jgi:hypothetical protein
MAFSPAGIKLMIWIIVFTAVTTVVIGLRLWAVQIKKRSLRADDYLVFVAYVSAIRMVVLFYNVSLTKGLDQHLRDVVDYVVGNCKWPGCSHQSAQPV